VLRGIGVANNAQCNDVPSLPRCLAKQLSGPISGFACHAKTAADPVIVGINCGVLRRERNRAVRAYRAC
jgi:hypothetical protein